MDEAWKEATEDREVVQENREIVQVMDEEATERRRYRDGPLEKGIGGSDEKGPEEGRGLEKGLERGSDEKGPEEGLEKGIGGSDEKGPEEGRGLEKGLERESDEKGPGEGRGLEK